MENDLSTILIPAKKIAEETKRFGEDSAREHLETIMVAIEVASGQGEYECEYRYDEPLPGIVFTELEKAGYRIDYSKEFAIRIVWRPNVCLT